MSVPDIEVSRFLLGLSPSDRAQLLVTQMAWATTGAADAGPNYAESPVVPVPVVVRSVACMVTDGVQGDPRPDCVCAVRWTTELTSGLVGFTVGSDLLGDSNRFGVVGGVRAPEYPLPRDLTIGPLWIPIPARNWRVTVRMRATGGVNTISGGIGLVYSVMPERLLEVYQGFL